MIRIVAVPIEDGMMLRVMGHADYAPKGQDVVCAGVSALLAAFLTYLQGIAPAHAVSNDGVPHLIYEEGEGMLLVMTHGLGGRECEAWRVIMMGLSLIRQAHPTCLQLDDRVESVPWDEVDDTANKKRPEKGVTDGYDRT